MSIDFAKVEGIEIPEGIVTEIKDAAGRVIWSAVKMAKLTITSFWDGMDGDTARITITSPSPFVPDPSNPSNKVTLWTAYVYDLFDQQNRTIKIPIGSTIECYITRDKGNADSYIKLNGVNVATGEGTYIYTVTGDATIDVSEDYIQGDFGVISIVGAVTYISFSVNGETYQSIEGMTWASWFASSYNTTGKAKGDVNSIKDANGNAVSLDSVIISGTVYEVEFGGKAVLMVEKITSDTYAGETTYTGEQFVLLDIYPKNRTSTVKVTYGGLTKTLTFSGTNAQQVFFGTFNGVSDSVATPASGELTIEGGYSSFACSSFTYNNKSATKRCSCITDVVDWGDPTRIGSYAFYGCTKLALTSVPEGIKLIDNYAFSGCTNLSLVSLPNSLKDIRTGAFEDCTNLALTPLPSELRYIGANSFRNCTNLALTSLPSGVATIEGGAFEGCTNLALTALPDSVTSVGIRAFYGCSNITVNKMPSGFTAIPDNCFTSCRKVNAGTFDYTGITTIGKGAFASTDLVSIIRLPEGVVQIGSTAFSEIIDIVSQVSGGDERIYIPSTVTEIGGKAFFRSYSGNPRTVSVYCYATTPPTITTIYESTSQSDVYEIFHEYDEVVKITVPKGCSAAYKAAPGWSDYADKITEAT